MRRDKNAPVLYELMRDRSATRQAVRPPPPTAAQPDSERSAPRPAALDTDAPATLVTPGRSVRVPIGYFAPLAILLGIFVVGAYVVGYNRRDNEIKAQIDADGAAAMDAVDPLAVVESATPRPSKTIRPDPIPKKPANLTSAPSQRPAASSDTLQLQQRNIPSSERGAPTTTQPSQKPSAPEPSLPKQPEPRSNPPIESAPVSGPKPSQPPTAPATPPTNTAPAAAKGVVLVAGPKDDPRQLGLNYLIAATLPRDEAEKAAQFLFSRGLEVAVVPADNGGSQRWVVVLEGLTAKDLGGPRARSLESTLQQLGRVYKQELKGPTVFNDPWWKKHSKDPPRPADE